MNCRVFSTTILGSFLLLGGCVPSADLPGQGDDDGKIVIYRDSWGVAHLYAPTMEGGAYAMGWAQAEDRPVELLKNFLRGMGEVSSVDGPASLQSDLLARLFDHYGVSKRNLDQLSDRTRALVSAYVRGVNDYYRASPADLPGWWGDRQVDEAMVHAFGRYFLYSWSIDDGFGDLRRGGLMPDFREVLRGSNQMAISPQRSAEGAAILIIDPHLSWFGASRFWELRIHAGDLRGSGVTLPGFPVIGLGHNENVAWAMTTGGPDTADIYELILKPDDPDQYYFDGQWRSLEKRDVELNVAGVGTRTLTIRDSHLGPIVAMEGRRAFSLRTSYAEEVRNLDAWYAMNMASDYRGVARALEMRQVFPQNVMVADTKGNIYYQRTGRVPIRAKDFDWSRPVPGSSPATDWQGIHPTGDLVQLLNPPQGYMQNCNIPPDAMMVNSPLRPEKYPEYVFCDRWQGGPGGRSNPRGARAVQVLSSDNAFTADEAIALALDIHPFGSENWIEALRLSHQRLGASWGLSNEESVALGDLLGWDCRLGRESSAALKYFYWRRQVEESGDPELRALENQLVDFYAPVEERGVEPNPSDKASRALGRTFLEAMERLREDFGGLDLRYGDVFRVGRGEASWPVGGGGDFGTSTLRNVNYGKERDDKTFWGRSGQTSTQVVVLGSPIRSWTALPLGQSDRPDSPHFTDQAEKLFSERRLKSTWWTAGELKDHVESRTILTPSGLVTESSRAGSE